jgi:hypothetical protein
MNFKQIVAKVNLHAGLQGVVSSVESTGYQQYLAEAVRSAWSDLQLLRKDWKFMWETIEFTTQEDTHEYTAEFLTSAYTWGVSKWKIDTLLRNDNKQIYQPFDNYWNAKEQWESSNNPNMWTIREYRQPALIIVSPNSTDVIRADYYRTPQLLTSNTDVPLLPEEFHYLIVWRALEDVAAWLGNSSIYERHSYKSDILVNQLMRSQVPAKRIKKKPFYRSPVNQY